MDPTNTDSQTVPSPYSNDPRVEKDAQGVWHIRGYAEARDLLKEDLIQDGFNAGDVHKAGFDAVLYQHGEAHRQSRAAIAKYFSPTTVQQTHMAVIERTANELVADLIRQKSLNLRMLSRQMAMIIASVVVGLNPTKGMEKRLDMMLHTPKLSPNPFVRKFEQLIMGNYRRLAFFYADVMPAIRERRKKPQNDVVSYMLSRGKRPLDIWVECVVYAAAGMATTQEFICIVLLHCLKNPEVREIMISDDKDARYETLNEILRLEPVIANIYRKAHAPITVAQEGRDVTIPAGDRIAFHIYDVNVDPKAAGEAPAEIHPHRDMEKGVYRSMLGFGSGLHRCAGEHLAIAETDVFINKILQVPGLHIQSGPQISRNDTVEGYEVNNLIIAVD